MLNAAKSFEWISGEALRYFRKLSSAPLTWWFYFSFGFVDSNWHSELTPPKWIYFTASFSFETDKKRDFELLRRNKSFHMIRQWWNWGNHLSFRSEVSNFLLVWLTRRMTTVSIFPQKMRFTASLSGLLDQFRGVCLRNNAESLVARNFLVFHANSCSLRAIFC